MGTGLGMGLLRLFCIFIGLALCSEMPTDDGTSMFRGYFAFFILIALDYARMWFKGQSSYEKILGFIGLFFALFIITINWLATSKHLVLQSVEHAYYIVSSDSFGLVKNLKVNVYFYFKWTTIITMSLATMELLVPIVNRYNIKKEDVSSSRRRSRLFFGRKREEEVEIQLIGSGVTENK